MEPATPEQLASQPMSQSASKEPQSKSGLPKAIVKQLRPKQWAKNLIIYTAPLFGGRFNDPQAILSATECVASFCLISSGIYILNDVVDVEADRAHPTKRFRPIACGELSIPLAVVIGVVCVSLGFLIAFLVRPSLVFICLAYVVLNVLYSKYLKNFAIIDIFCIASGFVLRAVAGAVAVKVMPSVWFLLCTSLGALFLALEKRRQEVLLLSGKPATRKVLSDYSPKLLQRIENLIVPSLVTSYAFYSFQSPHGQAMMATVPIVLYGVMRYQLLSERGSDTATPEEVFWKDRPIQMTLILWVLACALVVYGHPVSWVESVARYVDSFRLGF
jgi:4-hydroxybenzoate polyprenyltransferase